MLENKKLLLFIYNINISVLRPTEPFLLFFGFYGGMVSGGHSTGSHTCHTIDRSLSSPMLC